MNLKVECPDRYLYDVTGVARRNPDDVSTNYRPKNWKVDLASTQN